MSRYYFHYRGPDDQLIEDRLGSYQPDLDAVEREARLIAKEILMEELEDGAPAFAVRSIEIEDETGELVLYLPFWAALLLPSPTGSSLSKSSPGEVRSLLRRATR
jgi:hypothetical protein